MHAVCAVYILHMSVCVVRCCPYVLCAVCVWCAGVGVWVCVVSAPCMWCTRVVCAVGV